MHSLQYGISALVVWYAWVYLKFLLHSALICLVEFMILLLVSSMVLANWLPDPLRVFFATGGENVNDIVVFEIESLKPVAVLQVSKKTTAVLIIRREIETGCLVAGSYVQILWFLVQNLFSSALRSSFTGQDSSSLDNNLWPNVSFNSGCSCSWTPSDPCWAHR